MIADTNLFPRFVHLGDKFNFDVVCVLITLNFGESLLGVVVRIVVYTDNM